MSCCELCEAFGHEPCRLVWDDTPASGHSPSACSRRESSLTDTTSFGESTRTLQRMLIARAGMRTESFSRCAPLAQARDLFATRDEKQSACALTANDAPFPCCMGCFSPSNVACLGFSDQAFATATEMQAATDCFSRLASMPPAAPMATICVLGARWPHSSCNEMSTRLPTTCSTARRCGASVV